MGKQSTQMWCARNHLHAILRKSSIEPIFQLCRQEAKDEVECTANEFRRRLTEDHRPRSLPPEVIIQAHIIGVREARVIDLQKIADKFIFAIYQIGQLFQEKAKDLESK